MDREINNTYWTTFGMRFHDYAPPPKGTPERKKEGLEIEKRLRNLTYKCQKYGKEALPHIFYDLKFFAKICERKEIHYPHKQRKYMSPRPTHSWSKPFAVACSIVKLLQEPTLDFYSDLRILVGCMYLAMKKSFLFDWA